MWKRRQTPLSTCVFMGLLCVGCVGGGCSYGEAVVDGFFGGISDAVAAVVSQFALSIVPGATP